MEHSQWRWDLLRSLLLTHSEASQMFLHTWFLNTNASVLDLDLPFLHVSPWHILLEKLQGRQKVKDNQGEDLYAYGILLISLQCKCEQYWNDQLDKPYDAGSFTVVTTGCRGFADYVVRDLTLRSVSLSVAQAILCNVEYYINCNLSLAMFLHPCIYSPLTDPSV